MTTRVSPPAETLPQGLDFEGSPVGSGNENEGLTAHNRMCIKNGDLYQKKSGSSVGAGTKWKLYENPYYSAKPVSETECITVSQPVRSREGRGLERFPCKQLGRETLVHRGLGKRSVRVTPPPVLPSSSRSTASQGSQVSVPEPQKSKLSRPPKETQRSSNSVNAKISSEARQESFANFHELPKDTTTSTNYKKHPIHDESVLASLRSGLQASFQHLTSLEQAKLSAQAEIFNLRKEFDAKRDTWQSRMQAKVDTSIEALKGEANEERTTNKHLHMIHQNLEKDISEVKKSLIKVKHDLEKEREARKLFKDIGDELEKEIQADKIALRIARRETAKVRYEAEQERKMLQMGEIWKEEKVHTKLTQVRYEVEEKAMVLDELKHQLETFLSTRRTAFVRHLTRSTQEPMQKERPQNSLKRSSQQSSLPSRPGTPSNRALYGKTKVESGGQMTKQRRWNV